MVQIVINQPRIEPFRLERSPADWGWRLISTGAFADMAVMNYTLISYK